MLSASVPAQWKYISTTDKGARYGPHPGQLSFGDKCQCGTKPLCSLHASSRPLQCCSRGSKDRWSRGNKTEHSETIWSFTMEGIELSDAKSSLTLLCSQNCQLRFQFWFWKSCKTCCFHIPEQQWSSEAIWSLEIAPSYGRRLFWSPINCSMTRKLLPLTDFPGYSLARRVTAALERVYIPRNRR